jgi:hypothetical protein
MKYILVFTMMILSFQLAKAQNSENERELRKIGNIHRYKILADSLGMDRQTINRLIVLRGKFIDSTEQLSFQYDSVSVELTNAIKELRKKYIVNMIRILGIPQYKACRDFVSRRMKENYVLGKPFTED